MVTRATLVTPSGTPVADRISDSGVAAASGTATGIALDWGTTNLRAFLLDGAGGILEQREKPWGILSLPAAADAGGFDLALDPGLA